MTIDEESYLLGSELERGRLETEARNCILSSEGGITATTDPHQESTNSSNDERICGEGGGASNHRTSSKYREVQVLTVAVWTVCIMFGVYAIFHYIYSALVKGDWASWNKTDPGLYREGHVFPNMIMLIHIIAGSYLMLAGPIQLIPAIRKSYISLHKWVGRIYIGAAIMTSTFGITFCLTYGNARDDPRENIEILFMGISTFVCATQSYRYIKEKKIEEHKIWSYRLFLSILAAVLFRVYNTSYYALVVYEGMPKNGIIGSSIFYSILIPNLIILELIWRGKIQPLNHLSVINVCTAFVSAYGFLLFFVYWLPAILGRDDLAGSNLFVKAVDPHSNLYNVVSDSKACGIIILMIGGFLFVQYQSGKN